jgi:hypothetical protein
MNEGDRSEIDFLFGLIRRAKGTGFASVIVPSYF